MEWVQAIWTARALLPTETQQDPEVNVFSSLSGKEQSGGKAVALAWNFAGHWS
jgi:hypothetical protein